MEAVEQAGTWLELPSDKKRNKEDPRKQVRCEK